MKVLVTEPLSERALATLAREFQVDVREDLARGGLTRAIGEYEGLIVRSQTRVDAAVIEAGERLKVIARAGIGLDNVDVETATRRGVLVVNAPQSNIVSAAEHAIGLLLAQARSIPQADAALRRGEWDRERYRGVELAGKTLGVIGLGRVGTLVALRAKGFEMRVIAFDPYVPRDHGREIGVDLMPTLEALLVQADFVTIHVPRTPETRGLIGDRELSLMKEGARLVNTARGGIVDEDALARSLKDGHLGGAALDVFESEPLRGHPLIELDQVVLTPHLGATTVEAQDRAGLTIVEMVRLALRGEFVPYAVNVSAGAEAPQAVQPFLPLAERLGALLTGLADGAPRSIGCEFLGRIAAADTRLVTIAALKGCLSRVVHEPVSYVNAPVIARERGIGVSETRATASSDYVNVVRLRAETDGGVLAVAGTLVGGAGAERLVGVLEFPLDVALGPSIAFLLYDGRPDAVARVGKVLAEAGAQLDGIEVGRRPRGGDALMAITSVRPLPQPALAAVAGEIEARWARQVVLPERSS